jgi:flagellar biosynthesis/type III secretory pathway M-ring protein FliF/YscJ
MKIFNKKFLNQDEFRDTRLNMASSDKTRINYLLNQVLIWILIFVVTFLVIKFLNS